MRTAREMTCRELVELVTAYLENALAPPERARFDAHLEQCDDCRTYLEQMRETVHALGRPPEERLSPRARDELLRAFATWHSSG